MIAKHLRIHGAVQGVGYRQWMMQTARRLGIVGWVRNRGDGTVEALVEGDVGSVEELLRASRRGPPSATVTLIHEDLVEPQEFPSFELHPTAP